MSSALRTALAYMAEDAQAAPLPDNESQFVKGMRSGTYGMGSQLNSAVGAVADSLGGDQFAQERYAEANRLRGLAGQDGPRINSLEQLGNEGYSLRNMADYGMGVMGQAVPSLAPGLIPGMMASTPLRGLIGATAAYTPMEMGDTVQRMQELQGSPTMTGEQTLQALGTGAASSVAQSIVPAVIGGKLAGKVGNPVGLTMKQAVGRNLAGIPMEGATEAGGEAIKQLGSGQGYNGQQVLEAGVAGAIGGVPMSGVGAAGDYVHGRLNQAGQAGDAAKQALEGAKSVLQDAPKDLWGSAMDLAESAQKGLVESDLGKNISERASKFSERTASFLNDPEIDPETKAKVEEMVRQGANSTNAAMMWAMEKAQEGIKASTKAKDVVAESLHQTLSRFRSPADDTADKIMRGEPLADPGVMANGSDEQVKAGLAGSAQKATEWASKKADELMGKLDPESRDALQRFGGKFDTAEAQQYVAGLAKSFDDKTGFMDKAQRLGKTVSRLAGKDGQTEVKKSADESGVYAKMREVMAPYTKDVMAAVGNDEDAMHDVGKFLHNYVSAITDMKGKRHDPIDLAMARVQLASLLGDKAAPILADIAEKFGMAGNDRDSTDRLYAELAEAEKTRGIQSDLKGLLEKSLSKEVVARNPSLQRKQGDVVETLMSWATRSTDGTPGGQVRAKFENAQIENFLKEHYGTKSRAILRAVERAVTQMQLGTEVDGFDPNTSIADSKLSDEPTYVGKGSKGQTVLVTSAAASRSRAPQYVSDAENMMARLKEKHPGASITFRSLAEDPTLIDRIPAEKAAVTKERNRLEKEYPGEKAAKYREQELNAFRAGRIRELQEAGKGLFEIRQLRNEGQLSEEEDDAMRMDTEAYGHKDHPSRIEATDAAGKKHIFDAVKITREMMRKINTNREWTQEDDNLSDMSRAARAFHDGVGMLMEKYGKFGVPDDTIVYAINKKQITAGDLAKLDRRTSKDKALDLARAQLRDAQQEMKVLTDELVVAKSEGNKRLLREITNERTALNKDITRLNKFVEENSGAAADTDPDEFGENTAAVNDQRDGRQDADQDGNIHMAAARLKGNKLVVQRNMDGSLKGAASRAGGYQAGKEAFPQMMTNAIEAYDTQVRSSKPGKASTALMEKVLNNVRLLSEYATYMDPVTREKMRSILFDENGRARKVTDARDAARAMIAATTNLRAKVDANERARRANVQYEPPEPAAKGAIPENPVRFDKEGRALAEGPTSPKVRAAQVAAKKESFLARAASGDKALLAELKSSTDAKGLQRAVGALIKAGVAPDVAETINARIAELAKDPNVAYGMQTRKYSLLGASLHLERGYEGFPATHDSPHRHEGKFDWRAHIGKGEGNAAFGAGTYLSTAEGVHKSYKGQFTAMVNGPGRDEMVKMLGRMEASAKEMEFAADPDNWVPFNNKFGRGRQLKGDEAGEHGSFTGTTDIQSGDVQWFAPHSDEDAVAYGSFEEAHEEEYASRLRSIKREITSLQHRIANYQEKLYDKSPTYEVSVKIKPEELLDWNKPLSEQSELVKKATEEALNTLARAIGAFGRQYDDAFYSLEEGRGTGGALYEALVQRLGSQAKASDYLQSLGILGHRYAAAGGRNDAHPNYVIYDDSKIETNYVHFSQEEVGRQFEGEAGNAMPVNAKEILDHLHKVLGDSVQVEFGKMMYAGDFTRTEMEDVIRISVHALNPMSVAHHESLHAFFAQLKDKGLPDVVNAVYKGLNSPHIMAQLRERLKHSPAALAQLADPEERAAYAYQFYMTDPTFKIKAETRTVFEQIAAMVRKVLGIWSNDERALEIFDYFASGRYQQQSASKYAVHTALMKSGRNSAIDTANKMIAPLARLGDEIVGAGSERLRDSGIPALRELADTIKLRGTDEGRDAGYLPAARLARSEHINKLAKALNGYSQSHLAEALDALHRGDKAVSKEARTIQLITKRFLREMLTYVQQSGVGIGDLGPDYFPRVWDANYINSHREEFATMLAQYGMDDSVMEKVINDINTLPEFEVEKPGFASKNKRKLAFIEGKDAEPFLQKDFWKTMDSYITQAAHRSEWSRRFGADNEVLDTLLAKAKTQGATEDQLHMADRYVKAVNGTLGDEIDPHFRHLQGNIIAYQNIRLLPLALFSSLVDPLGIIVRGGQVKDGWETFKRGIKELHKSWQGNPSFDAKTRLAEEIGTIEDAVLQHTISSAYGQGMMGDTAQKVNDAFFRYNFMEGFNRSMRVGATQAALGFIKRHAMGENEHSMRYLKELGLSPRQVKFDADGNVVIDEAVKRAVNRWVDGAVLRPDAADSAIWMNDPHFAVIAHLKHFAFSFHHTFLKRVWHEYQHGNYQPLMALGAFVPMMMAADFIKDIATNGGDEPAWKREWTFMDHVGYGVERSGLLGVGQFALDGLGDVKNGGTGVGALGGPAIDQIADAVSLLGGHRTFESFALRSMPANALYRGYAETGGATELEFDGDSMN